MKKLLIVSGIFVMAGAFALPSQAGALRLGFRATKATVKTGAKIVKFAGKTVGKVLI